MSTVRVRGDARRRIAPAPLSPVRSDRASLVGQTHRRLLEAIVERRFSPGQRLPSEPQLADSLGVSRGTLREALGILQQQGHIYRRVGDGTYAADSRHVFIERLEVFESIEEVAAAQRITLRPVNTRFETIRADTALAGTLRLRPGEPVHVVTRTLDSELGPLVHMVDIVPASVMSLKILRSGFTGVVRSQLAVAVPDVAFAESEIFTNTAAADIAAALGIPLGSTYLVVEETVYTKDERPVEHSINHYNSQKVRFRLRQRHQRRR
jgi:GntR family transcriptional regulator